MRKNLLKKFINLANLLDINNLVQEAKTVDRILRQAADEGPKMESGTRNKINAAVDKIATGSNHKYYHSVGEAFEQITEAMKSHGAILLMEDGTKFAGFFSGRDGKTELDVAPLDASKDENTMHQPYINTMLVFSWHKMENNTYEIGCYLS